MNCTGLRAFAAFHQPRCAVTAGAPQASPFPARIRVVNAAIHSLGKEAHGVGDTHIDHLAVFVGNESAVQIASSDRDVLAQAHCVVLVNPGVVTRFGTVVLEAFMTWAWEAVVGKAFWAMVSCRRWSNECSFALAAIEAHESTILG